MFSKILIATDGSALAAKGVTQGLELAKALGSQVIILNASEPWTPIGADATGMAITEYALSDEFDASAKAAADKILADAAAVAKQAGVEVTTLYVPRTYPADAIIETAESSSVELIVMTSHGRRGVRRLMLGSQTNEVVTRSAIPVLVIR